MTNKWIHFRVPRSARAPDTRRTHRRKSGGSHEKHQRAHRGARRGGAPCLCTRRGRRGTDTRSGRLVGSERRHAHDRARGRPRCARSDARAHLRRPHGLRAHVREAVRPEREAANRPAARGGPAQVLGRQADGHDPPAARVRFNDGTAFNAAAVKKSLERHKTLPRSTRASELAPVTSIATSGNYTVILRLDSRYSPITAQLADRAGMIMSPKQLDALGDRFGTEPVCVGPFSFKERVAADHITLTKSPYYYARNKVRLAQIVWRIITDPSARTQNLRAGSVQVESAVESTDIPTVSRNKSLRIIKSTSIGYQGITINIGNKNGLGKQYTNVGTSIARSAGLRACVQPRARPQADQQARVRRDGLARLLPDGRRPRRGLRRPRGSPVTRRRR